MSCWREQRINDTWNACASKLRRNKMLEKGSCFGDRTSKSYSAVHEAHAVLTTGIEPTKTNPKVKTAVAFERTDTVMTRPLFTSSFKKKMKEARLAGFWWLIKTFSIWNILQHRRTSHPSSVVACPSNLFTWKNQSIKMLVSSLRLQVQNKKQQERPK